MIQGFGLETLKNSGGLVAILSAEKVSVEVGMWDGSFVLR